jgi:hypothetical protein
MFILKKFKSNSGATLIVVLLVMVVSIILMTSLLSLSLSDTILAVNQEKNLQAEYIAKAGADIVSHDVLSNPEVYSSYNLPKTISDTVIGEGSFSAEIRMEGNDIIVETEGVVDDSSQAVLLNLGKASFKDIFRGIQQTGEDDLDIDSLDITYEDDSTVHIEANVSDLNDIILSSNQENDPNIIPDINNESPGYIVIPTHGASEGDISGTTTISGNHYYNLIETGGNKEIITFDTQGVEQTIIADEVSFTNPKSEVKIIGGGVLHLYILDKGEILSGIDVNENDPTLFFIYLKDGANLDLQAGGTATMYVFGPEATIQMNSDKTMIKGAIIGEILQKNEGGTNNNGPHGKFHFIPLPNDYTSPSIVKYEKKYYSN